MGVRTLRQLACAEPEKLAKFVHKDIKVCSSLINKAASIADFFAKVSTLAETMRVVVKTKPHSPSADEQSSKQTCTLLVWVPEKILLYREGVGSETAFDVPFPRPLKESSRFIYVRLFHDQFAGIDERFEVALEEDAQTCQTTHSVLQQTDAELHLPAKVMPTRNAPIHAGSGEVNERCPSPSNQDSRLLKEIKKLERHQKSAKQQSIFQFLRHIPESEAFTPGIHQGHQQSDDFKLHSINKRVEMPRQPDYAMAPIPDTNARAKSQTYKRAIRSKDKKARSTKIPENVAHAITSDEDSTYCTSIGANITSKQASSSRDSQTKRKATENLFAHFRLTKRSAVKVDRRMKSSISSARGTTGRAKPSEVSKTNSDLATSRSVAPFGSPSFEASKLRSRSTKLKTTKEPAPLDPLDVAPCPIRSTPFFKSFVREKVNMHLRISA